MHLSYAAMQANLLNRAQELMPGNLLILKNDACRKKELNVIYLICLFYLHYARSEG